MEPSYLGPCYLSPPAQMAGEESFQMIQGPATMLLQPCECLSEDLLTEPRQLLGW